jgi:hypothetical protein
MADDDKNKKRLAKEYGVLPDEIEAFEKDPNFEEDLKSAEAVFSDVPDFDPAAEALKDDFEAGDLGLAKKKKKGPAKPSDRNSSEVEPEELSGIELMLKQMDSVLEDDDPEPEPEPPSSGEEQPPDS